MTTYPSTVYKAQGASIKDVYVLHNVVGNNCNSYVAMTRHVEQVKLYYNREVTKNMAILISQLSKMDHRMASTSFYTKEDLAQPKLLDKIGSWLKSAIDDIQDQFYNKYYQPIIKPEPIAKVIGILEQTASSNNINLQEGIMASEKIDYKQELIELKQRLPFNAERIAIDLLGKPNKYLSNNYVLRWGEDGKIAMKIKGDKAGIWYDFSRGEGGDLLKLVQEEKSYNFVQAKQYLQDIVGVQDFTKLEQKVEEKNDREEAKIKRAHDLYNNSKLVIYGDSVARIYISEHRGIKSMLDNLQLSQDIKTNMMWDPQTRQYYPALVAFARDKEGKITGGQSIYLNRKTGAKADIAANKRSFGKISGSFVNVQQDKNNSNVTIIAEGIETALSLQEAGIKGRILCSLGVNNVKNYQPKKEEKILIAADNDGKNSVSLNTINKAREELINKEAVVSIVTPREKGDFNDMLKNQGTEEIRKIIEPKIAKLATNLWILKPKDASMSLKFQHHINELKRFATREHMGDALRIYRERDIRAFMEYCNRACMTAIEQKITQDLQIMKNKFDPNYNLGDVKFSEITVQDFNGRKHVVPEDYLASMERDKQVMQYIKPDSIIGRKIDDEAQQIN